MKKGLILLACMAILFSVSCKKKEDTAQQSSNEQVLVLGLDDSFPPMGFRDKENKIVGFDIDLATEVAKKLNMKLELRPIDWGAKELELNTNKITCIWNGLSVSPEREKAMTLSKPYLANKMVIITKIDSGINKKADLEGKKVGLQLGSTAVMALAKDPISKKVTQVTSDTNILALADLNIGRIDAVIMDEVVARYIMSQSSKLYKILDETFSEEYYAIAFKKGNTELRDKVDNAINELVKDGTALKISEKWFGKDLIVKQ